ncbi:MAG: hypothetical protein V2I51_01905 [Anderseniella sp.]|nr:hypothetical protein [Anderseniella sp.]
MRMLLLAAIVATGSLFATTPASTAAPVAPAMSVPYEMAADAIQQSVLPVHWAGPRHNCRVHGHCGGGGGIYLGGPGIYFGPGYVGPGRSCRRVRRFCRREWGGGRSYRRCVRRQGCRP